MNGRYRNQNLIYIFALVGVLVAIYIVYQFLTAGVDRYLALAGGLMLLVGNLPDLVRSLQQRQVGTAMMNTLVGLALVSFFIGEIVLKALFWPLALLLLIAAAPLAINRAGATRAYLNTGRAVAGQLRGLLKLRQRTM